MNGAKNEKSFNVLPDVVSFFAFCSGDDSFLLSIECGQNMYWIPTIGVVPGDSWLSIKEQISDIFGIHVNIHRILRLGKIWQPNQKVLFQTNVVFELQIPVEFKKKIKTPLGKFKGKILWASESEITALYNTNKIKSPEIFQLIALARNLQPPPNIPPEYKNNGNYMELSESILVTARQQPTEQLVAGSGFDRRIQEMIYSVFIKYCYPVLYMTQDVFTQFVLGLGWHKEECPYLFYSADVCNRNALCFRELLYFLAAVEPYANHGGPAGELRCRYVFRYLDREKRNYLRREDMRYFFVCLRKSKNLPLEDAKIDKDLSDCYRTMKLFESQTISLNQFLSNVGDLKLRGTSQIYRSPIGIEKYFADDLYKERGPTDYGLLDGLTKTLTNMKRIPYELANHCITLKTQYTANVDQVSTIPNALSAMTLHQPLSNELLKQKSFEYFGTKTIVNELIKSIRYLAKLNKHISVYSKVDAMKYHWGDIDPISIANIIKDICPKVRDLVSQEPRLLEIQSPVYVLGDLHGNLKDLLQFERTLWPLGPGINPCNLLFLGDFVDRGLFSVEVIAYLLSCKLLSPKKVKLVRGNHEIKRVQQMWTFEAECRKKFGDKLYQSVFDAINNVFDHLPLAAVIDGKVFCCHGGIPPPWLCPLAIAINDIPVSLPNPQEQSSLAWELMWNDPIRGNIPENMTIELMANEGFAMNTRRGTGHMFSVEALEKFLLTNGYTHLIRAHEVAEAGFNLQQKARMFTIFSTSKYCNSPNEAACIFADHGQLRVFRIKNNE